MGVELEAPSLEAAQQTLGSEWEVGKHDSQDRIDTDGNLEQHSSGRQNILAEEKAFVANTRSLLEEVIGNNLNAYLEDNLGIVPNWILTLPETARMGVSYLYVFVVQQGEVPADLKHMMLYVLTDLTRHQYLNSLEGELAKISAIKQGISPDLAQKRLEQSIDAAKVKGGAYGDFSEKESAALWLATTAAVYPPFTPSPLVLSLKEHFTPVQIVELTMCLAVGGLAQRWTAMMKAEPETLMTADLIS